jgi:caa(3)-type oxidase subunit IV
MAHSETHHGGHHHPNYLAVFGVLVVLTAVSFWTVSSLWPLDKGTGHTLVMLVAVLKATLVAMYFMHLKFDWFKLYVMIVPALLLGTVAICALLPDITFSQEIKLNWLNVVGR